MAKRKSEEYLWPRTLTHSSILLYQLYKITHVIGQKCKNQVWLQPEFITLNLQTLRLRYYARFITVDRPLSRHDERVGFQKGKEGKVATTRILAHNLVPTWYKISPFFALPTLICHCMFSVKFLPFYDDYYYHVKSWLKITLTYFC